MRYTESRLSKLSSELLSDIDKDTVNFVATYDGSRAEPAVLPTRVPNLLLNGSIGIAVGMATNIPPHNLGELCDGIMHLIDHPEADNEALMEFVKGPDFPTGAEIHGLTGIRDAYTTGRGKVVMRAVASVEERKGGYRIVVTEIPYLVNKAELVAKIADLVRDKRVDGITDIRDESNREGIRVVIELKASSYPKKVLNKLYELTPLQSAFHVNTLALVNSIEPRVLTLRECLQEFISHRQVVVRRRSEFELAKAKDRAHILEGLIKAIDIIDEVVATIRASKNREEAGNQLMTKYGFSELQTQAILDMRLAQLVNLEKSRLEDELNEKRKIIDYLESLLASEAKILGVVKDETTKLRDQFAEPRRTVIQPYEIGAFSVEDLVPNEDVVITLTKTNYIKRVNTDAYRSQGRGGKGVVGMTTKDEDEVAYLFSAKTHDVVYFFTDKGRVFRTSVYEIPATSRQAKGTPIVNVIQIGQEEMVTTVLTLTKAEEATGGYFVMGTTDGTVKKTEVKAYANVRKNGIIAINLASGARLGWVRRAQDTDIVTMISARSQAILFAVGDVRATGRTAAGVRGMKLRPDDTVVAMDVLTKEERETSSLVVVFENGFGKRTAMTEFDLQGRGGMGIKAAAVTPKVGMIVHASVLRDTKSELMLISSKGTMLRIPATSAKKLGRVTQGVTLMKMSDGDRVASVAVVNAEEAVVEADGATE